MRTVRLTQNGALWREDMEAREVLPLLPLPVELDAGCTLRSFFAMLHSYPYLQDLSEFLPAALKEAANCPPTGCVSTDISVLVLGKSMELIGFPGKPRAELYTWLCGLGRDAPPAGAAGARSEETPVEEEQQANMGMETALARLMQADRDIRFMPLACLLDTPLALGGMKHVVLGHVASSLFCATSFTLCEVVDGMAWEIGFRLGATGSCALR